MEYLILILIIAEGLSEQILTKQYNIHAKNNNPTLFSGITCLFALLFFLLNSRGHLNFNITLLPYSISFATAFATAILTLNLAIKTGPLSLTMLFLNYSLLIPTFYGIIFLKEPTSLLLYIGITSLICSLYLISKKDAHSSHLSITWIIYTALAFISNGLCSTFQKMQQLTFNGDYKNEFMIVSLSIAAIILLGIGFVRTSDKSKSIIPCLKYGAFKGFENGFMNYLVMTATALLPNSVLYPCISAGGIILTFAVSIFVYKECLSKKQIIGCFMGFVSIILLNI